MKSNVVAIENLHPGNDQILRVEWNLGKRCNFDCSYCGSSTHDNLSPHLSLEVAQKTLQRLAQLGEKQGKKVKISFTGGEPFLNPGFLEILEMAKTLGIYRVSAISNGSLTTSLYLRSLQYLDHLIISYHFEFAKPEIVLRNIKSIHEEIQTRIKRNEARGFHVHIMLLPGHFAAAEDVIRQLKLSEINYAVRRIRPQLASDGEFLRPFNSGHLGVGRIKASTPRISYYSKEETQRMETGF